MGKVLSINAGKAILFNDPPESFSEYKSISINTGKALISRKVYEKLIGMGVTLSSGKVSVIDAEGEIAELPKYTVINAKYSYKGCFLICDGGIIIEDIKGLDGMTGLYADCVFYPESIDLNAVKGITGERVAYTDGAKLHFEDITLDSDACINLKDNTLHWIHGDVTALDGDALAKMQRKGLTFHCKRLTIYNSLYEKYGDMFQADKTQLIPDGYGVSWGLSLDAGTSLIYGEKLYVLGDLMIQYNRFEHLGEFSSVIVKGTVTMPVSAVGDFKAIGKADEYDLYEGVLREVNGEETINRDMLQTAMERGIGYTFRVNGLLNFADDVTAQDMDAIFSVECNGMITVSGNVRGALEAKIKEMNGRIGDADKKEKVKEEDAGVSDINTGIFKF